MDSQTLRRHLVKRKLPTQMKRLKNRARAIVDQLQDPALCYKAYYEDSIYDITCAELLCPVAPYHSTLTSVRLQKNSK